MLFRAITSAVIALVVGSIPVTAETTSSSLELDWVESHQSYSASVPGQFGDLELFISFGSGRAVQSIMITLNGELVELNDLPYKELIDVGHHIELVYSDSKFAASGAVEWIEIAFEFGVRNRFLVPGEEGLCESGQIDFEKDYFFITVRRDLTSKIRIRSNKDPFNCDKA